MKHTCRFQLQKNIMPRTSICLASILLLCIACCAVTANSQGDPKGYYQVLELSTKATANEIKSAYRKYVQFAPSPHNQSQRLSLKYHPDRNRKKSENEQQKLKEKYMKISEAYGILSDETKRKQYDRYGSADGYSSGDHESYHHHQDFGQHFDFSSFFSQFQNPSFMHDNDDDSNTFFTFSTDGKGRQEHGDPFEFFKFSNSHQQQQPSFFESLFGGQQQQYNKGSQRIKKVVTKIGPDGSRTTQVIYEYVNTPQQEKKDDAFGFSFF